MKQKKKILLVFTLIVAMLCCPLAVFGADDFPAEEVDASDYQAMQSIDSALDSVYYIGVNPNSGSGGNKTFIVNAGDSFTFKTAEEYGITKAGHRFVEWNTEPTGIGTVYAANETIILDSDLIIFAIWKPDIVESYTVTYYGNGLSTGVNIFEVGPFVPGTRFVAASPESFGMNGQTASNGGQYVFKEWNTSANGKGQSIIPGETEIIITKGLVLYAIWEYKQEERVTVLYYSFETDELVQRDMSLGQPYSLESPEDLGMAQYPDHIFAGWRSNGDGILYQAGTVLDTTTYSNSLYLAEWEYDGLL